MSKPEQVLLLEPSHELKFKLRCTGCQLRRVGNHYEHAKDCKGPFTDAVTINLKLTNPSDRRVCFTVKTTAREHYCVRPNNGIVKPKGCLIVAVTLQPFEYDPNNKYKHKFMVQTMVVPEGDICQESLWKDVLPENLMDSKLRCVFEPAVNGKPQNNMEGSILPLTEVPKMMSIANTPEPISILSPKGGVCENLENDLKRTHDEMRRLEVENSDLRHEIAQLKEEGLRLRRQQQHQPVSGANTSSTEEYKASSAALLQPCPMMGYTPQQQIVLVMVAVAAFIVGLIVGGLLKG